MKNTLLALTAVSALALASCASDEPVNVNHGDSIAFRPAFATRATETTNANLQDIYVTSLLGDQNYFNDAKYSRQGTEFLSIGDYYWPADDTELQFYAYAPSAEELGGDIVINSSTKQLQNFYVADQIADQVDFITANATGKKSLYESTGMPLTFDHRLAQIEIQAKSENPHYNFEVIGVKIGRPQYLGTYDFATNEWTLDEWHDTNVWVNSCDTTTLTATPQSIMGPSGNAMMLPQTLTPWMVKGDPDNAARGAYLAVLVRITEKDSGTVIFPLPSDTTKDSTGQVRKYAWSAVPLSGTWEQGMKYIYVLDFTNGGGNTDPDDPHKPGDNILAPIHLNVVVNPWKDSNISIDETGVE